MIECQAVLNEWLRKDTSFSTYKEGLLKLSTTLDMVGENVLANQLKLECGKWNNLSLITSMYNSLSECLMIIILDIYTTFSLSVVSTYKTNVTESLLSFLVKIMTTFSYSYSMSSLSQF